MKTIRLVAAALASMTIPLVLMSAATAQPAIPGFIGKIELKPNDYTGNDSYWYDTDGVNPASPGCHVGVDSATDKTPNGRFFPEACQSPDVLIESNPGKDVIHSHAKDVGHPYLVKCDVWCKDVQNAKGGKCMATKGPAPCTTSAKCDCSR